MARSMAQAGLGSEMRAGTGGAATYGFVVVPVGLGWTLAAGVALVRSSSERRG